MGEACPSSSVAIQASGAVLVSTDSCCLVDCPIVVRSCPVGAVSGVECSGHGSCLTGTGVCVCFEGYRGDACESCDAHYSRRVDSGGWVVSCTLLPGGLSTCSNGVRDGSELGVDCGGVCPPCNGTVVHNASSTTALFSGDVSTLCVLGGLPVAAVIVVVAMAAYRKRVRQSRHSSGKPRVGQEVIWQRAGAVRAVSSQEASQSRLDLNSGDVRRHGGSMDVHADESRRHGLVETASACVAGEHGRPRRGSNIVMEVQTSRVAPWSIVPVATAQRQVQVRPVCDGQSVD